MSVGRRKSCESFCTSRSPSRYLAVTSVTPGSLSRSSIWLCIASAAPGSVKAARPASGSDIGFGATGPSRFARASAIFFGMPAGPDAGAGDARASAVDVDRVEHQIEVFLPVVDHVVAEEDLRKARSVSLHARVAVIPFDRRRCRRRSSPDRSSPAGRHRIRVRRDRCSSPHAGRRPERTPHTCGTASTVPADRA